MKYPSSMIVILIAALCGFAFIDAKSYDGYKLLRFYPKDAKQVKLLTILVPNDIEGSEISFWSGTPSAGNPVDVLVSPSRYREVIDFAQQNNLKAPKLLIPDLQKILTQETGMPQSQLRQSGAMVSTLNPTDFFSNFRRLSAIYSFMDRLVEMYPRLATVQSIGQTSEGREMRILKISSSPAITANRQINNSKPIFWIDAGIHAREWAAPSTALFLAYGLLSQYNKQPDIRKIVDNFEWHILPVANPDGYEYTFTDDRLWRKTRSRNSYSSCRGVDPNRNFGFHWREAGASSNPCSETYAGPKAFSEPETMNMASHLWRNRQRLLAYVALHSYGQYWLTPWGFTSNLPDDYYDLQNVASRAANAVEKVYGTKYKVGSSTRVLYAAAGGSDDWSKGVAGAKYAFTVEVRPGPNAARGFVMSPSQIKPCGLETMAGIVQLAKDISDSQIVIETRRTRRSIR